MTGSKRNKHSRQIRLRLFSQRNQCWYCGAFMTFDESTLDHVIPRSRGGGNHQENLVLACHHCNVTKNDLTPEEWESVKQAIQ